MHTVTLTPDTIDLTAGGSPVDQLVTVGNVTEDVTVTNPLTVSVGTVDVVVNTTVTVDHPSPTVAVISAAPGDYAVVAATPAQTATPGEWEFTLTYTPV